MQWLDGADMRAKLTAIYLYLNNGEPISAPMIAKLLKHVYPETREVCHSLSLIQVGCPRAFPHVVV